MRSVKESVTYQAILEEGAAKGRREGALTEAKRILLRLGQGRLGPPDARVRSALEGITDVERLEALGERVYSAASWEELLALSSRRAPPRRRTTA
jgi:hypothetical protein